MKRGGLAMSLINKENFDILQYCEEGKEDEYFEVDENIALVISMLNKKGYKTTFCCSGHAFPGISEFYADSKEAFECIIFSDLQGIRYENDRYKATDRKNAKYCYVGFEEDYPFPKFPDGFIYDEDDKSIEKDYISESDTYDLIQEIVDTMKKLYEWAKELQPLG